MMKKLFAFMTIVAAMAMSTVSCGSDDDEGDKTDPRLTFTNKLTQDSTTCTWEGYERTMTKSWGNWSASAEKYVVMRFDRASKTAIEGDGILLQFGNDWKENCIDKSDIKWRFVGDELHISYRHEGWAAVHAEFNTTELRINGDKFEGTWFESDDTKFEFSYKKSSFSDWNKFVN